MPVPYKLFSISSGVFDINIFAFSLATIAGQGLKYYTLALLTIKIGPKVKELFKLRIKLITIVAVTGIIAAFILIRFF